MLNKIVTFLLIFAIIIGVFTFRINNFDFSLEAYAENISELEETPTFPNLSFEATERLSDAISSITDSDRENEMKLLEKIWSSILGVFLRLGYIFTVIYDLGYWIINFLIYMVRLIVWFTKFLSLVFINPKVNADTNFYNNI